MAEHTHRHGNAHDYATVLEHMNRFQEPEGRAAIAALHLPLGSYGLDVGCGVGLYALWLAEALGPHGRVLGIDPSAERIAAAQQLVGHVLAPERLTFRQGDGTALDAAAQTFDWLWCGDVLHHIDEPLAALREFIRVLRPGGLLIVKESQLANALFLPGYPELERQLQRVEIQYNHHETGARSFQERRQRTLETMYAAGLRQISVQTYLVQRQAPLDTASRTYIEQVIFARNWGPRLRGLLDTQDWQQRSALCSPDSPDYMLARPDYYCLYPLTVFAARVTR